MRRVLLTLAISLTPLSPLGVPGFATPVMAQPAPAKLGPASTVVKQTNDKVKAQINSKAPSAQVIATVQGFLDIDELGKRAMVNNWSKLKPDQQKDFLKILRDLIEANYVSAQQANVQYTVDYLGEAVNAQGDTVVNTQIKAQRKGRPFSMKIDYVMIKKGASFQCFDVVTDGVSLVDNYKSTFDKLMKDKGFDGLMTTMKTKLQQIQAQGGGAAPAKKT